MGVTIRAAHAPTIFTIIARKVGLIQPHLPLTRVQNWVQFLARFDVRIIKASGALKLELIQDTPSIALLVGAKSGGRMAG